MLPSQRATLVDAAICDDVKSTHSARKMECADELLEVLNRWRQITQFSTPEDRVFASPYKLGRHPLSYTFVWERLRDAATVKTEGSCGLPIPAELMERMRGSEMRGGSSNRGTEHLSIRGML
jgi:hypothetical protein